MLLAIDLGNTQTALGLFDGAREVRSWRMPTEPTFTADELHMRLTGYLGFCGLTTSAIDQIALAGVVPQLVREWDALALELVGADRYVRIGRDTASVTKVRAERPEEVGADRVANAVAAEAFYGSPSIVVDFGTATNVDVVAPDGAYIGGAIAPGIRISFEALCARAAKIAAISLEEPAHAIGRDTAECVRVGTVVGAAAMAEGLVARMRAELGAPQATAIATGGYAPLIARSTDVFDAVDVGLTLRGIREIVRRLGEFGR